MSRGSEAIFDPWVGAADTVPDSATGWAISFAGGVGGGVGGVSCFFVSKDPTCSCPLYFLRMPSLWYFQNCFEASFPATLCSTIEAMRKCEGSMGCKRSYSSVRLSSISIATRHITMRHCTWMLILKLRQVINIIIDDDPKIILGLVRRNHVLRKRLRHSGNAR